MMDVFVIHDWIQLKGTGFPNYIYLENLFDLNTCVAVTMLSNFGRAEWSRLTKIRFANMH